MDLVWTCVICLEWTVHRMLIMEPCHRSGDLHAAPRGLVASDRSCWNVIETSCFSCAPIIGGPYCLSRGRGVLAQRTLNKLLARLLDSAFEGCLPHAGLARCSPSAWRESLRQGGLRCPWRRRRHIHLTCPCTCVTSPSVLLLQRSWLEVAPATIGEPADLTCDGVDVRRQEEREPSVHYQCRRLSTTHRTLIWRRHAECTERHCVRTLGRSSSLHDPFLCIWTLELDGLTGHKQRLHSTD